MSGSLGWLETISVAVAAATSSGNRHGCSQDYHSDGVVSQSGPYCHNFEDVSAWLAVPLGRRSAGCASVGQYLQFAFRRFVCISVTQFRTKVGSCFVLLITMQHKLAVRPDKYRWVLQWDMCH